MRKFGKHVALLMAVVMVLTMVPAMPISAAESQSTAISSISVLNTSNFALNSSTPAGVRTFSAQFGTIYNQGDLVEYNGRIYEVLQTFTFYGDPLWHPGIAPSLWRFVGTGVGSGTNPPIGGRDFIPRFGEIFIMGEIIRYNGRLYEVLQTFRFYGDPLWHPGIAPSLWRFVGLCTGGTNGGNNGGENGNDDPDPMLTILTDYIVTVFVDGNEFPLNTAVSVAAGSQIDFIIIPDRGSRLYSAVANRGELVQINQFAYSFTMPSSNARISLSFQTLVPMPDPLFPAERRSPIMTVRGFTENNIMTSAVYDDFRFIRGEILIYARWSVQYHEMEELARSFGGEIVGFLEVPNVFQVYFHGRSELQLWHLIEVFNNRNDITLAVLNSVFEMAESPEAEPEPEPLALGIATLFGEDDAIGLRPNDPFFNGQHGLQSINAPRAWAILEAHRDPENSTPVNIGIMDTLFEPHEDMSNLTIIQDLRRFCTRNCTEDEECTLSCVAVTYDWHRDHGLRVASVIGADSNNNRGMAGVAWYSRLYGFALSATPSTITEVIPVSTTLATYQYGLTRLF
ncbi:MAG: S8 family serine peptidase, partial [Defluviitaleaceae bacterium]|nr:S8 family serine peptidase [Defluviitaleaceae bacterium]